VTRLSKLTLVALASLLALPAAVRASALQESLFQDDGALVASGDARREQTLDRLRTLGVDTIRVNLIWNRVAPAPWSKRWPRFDAADPAAYDFSRYDAVVRGANARGLAVMLTLTGPAPAWASRCGGSAKRRSTCDPSPADFGRFAAAAGLHYPAVRRWSVWNEPNLAAWLYPQWRRKGGRHRPYAPLMYRGLAYRAIEGLRGSGHGSDRILLGETGPVGRHRGPWAKRSLPPAAFVADLFCMSGRGHRLRGAAARALGCHRRYRRLGVTGYAHHPYSRAAAAGPRSRMRGGDIGMSNLGRLSALLHHAARLRELPRGIGVYLTEYGVQTDPPDRVVGVSPRRQAEWLNEMDYMAYRNHAVRSVAQYELFDDPGRAAFQTGLVFAGGRPKRSLGAYELPIWVVRRHRRTTVWGQVRPAGAGARVEILYRPGAHGAFRRAATATTRPRGFFTWRTRRRGSRWLFRWIGPSGHPLARSRTAEPHA
jgi:hypothetical protein